MRSMILSQCRDLWIGVTIKRRFRRFNHSTCKPVLNSLEAVYLRFKKIVVERVAVVKFRWTIEAAMVLAVLESR